MKRTEMTPKEFYIWWGINDFTKQYSKTSSKEKKISLLEEWGVPNKYEEAERAVWLDDILYEYTSKDAKKKAPIDRNMFEKRLRRFERYLRKCKLRDYEMRPLMYRYAAALSYFTYRDGVFSKEDFVNSLKGMGLLSE